MKAMSGGSKTSLTIYEMEESWHTATLPHSYMSQAMPFSQFLSLCPRILIADVYLCLQCSPTSGQLIFLALATADNGLFL